MLEIVLFCFPLVSDNKTFIEAAKVVLMKHIPKSRVLKKSWQSRFREFGIRIISLPTTLVIEDKKEIIDIVNSTLSKENQIHLLSYISNEPTTCNETDIDLTILESELPITLNPQWNVNDGFSQHEM